MMPIVWPAAGVNVEGRLAAATVTVVLPAVVAALAVVNWTGANVTCALVDPAVGAALHAAKRVKHETGLVGGRHSVGAEAASLAARRHGPLSKRRCIVVGCGKTGERAARQLVVSLPAAVER